MFPKDFIWGVACASYQCEGAWNEDGKGRNIWDDFTHVPGNILNGDTGDRACDSYHRWAEDVRLMKQFGIQAYRFSISWARIIPDGDGAVNEKGLEFYDNLVNALIASGIKPMITLYHWDLPSALQDKGGWLNRDIVSAFGRYARVIAEHFKGRVDTYMTLNEPQCVTGLGYLEGIHAPGWKLGEREALKCYFNLCLAHSEATRQIRQALGQDCRIGVASCGRLCYPRVDTPAGREAAYKATFDPADWVFSMNIFLDPLFFRRFAEGSPKVVEEFAAGISQADWDSMEAPDFVGINVYQGDPVEEDGSMSPIPAGFPLTATKWKVTPEVLHFGPMQIYQRYGKPVLITENGLSCNDRVYLDGKVHDADRIDFLTRYLRALSQASKEGVPLMGYLQWSFLDNFEWSNGYNERFGIIYVDYESCDRIPKDSAQWYAQVIASNGEILK